VLDPIVDEEVAGVEMRVLTQDESSEIRAIAISWSSQSRPEQDTRQADP